MLRIALFCVCLVGVNSLSAIGDVAVQISVSIQVPIPGAPTITGLLVNGTLIGPGGRTAAPRPTIIGTGIFGTTVTVRDNGTILATVAVLPDGSWSLTPTSLLTLGAHRLTAFATDAGLPSADSAPFDFTVTLAVGTGRDCGFGIPIGMLALVLLGLLAPRRRNW